MKALQIVAALAVVAGSSIALHHLALAQQSGIGRTESLRHDLPLAGREAIQVRVDFAPGAAFGSHTHGKPLVVLSK